MAQGTEGQRTGGKPLCSCSLCPVVYSFLPCVPTLCTRPVCLGCAHWGV